MSLPNTIIIPHGATEVRLAEWLMNELRTQAIIHRPFGTEERTVSMKAVGRILSEPPFDSVRSLHRFYYSLDYDSKKRSFRDLTVIPVLDVDDDRRSLGSYRSGDMFDGFFLGRGRIIPVYNNPNMEAVLERAGYGKVAHDLVDFQEFLDSTDVLEFRERMASCDSTNMECLVDHLIKYVPRFQR